MRWLVIAWLFISLVDLSAQESLSIATGDVQMQAPESIMSSSDLPGHNGRHYAFIKLDDEYVRSARATLEQKDITLLYYAGKRIYLAELGPQINLSEAALGISATGVFEPDLKISSLSANNGTFMDLSVLCAAGIARKEIIEVIERLDGSITGFERFQSGIVTVRIPPERIDELAQLPFVFWIENAPAREELLRYRGIANHRVNMLHDLKGLSGEGVVVGVGDGGKVGTHLDLDIDVSNFASGSVSNHATHVSGIITARDIRDPSSGQGMAPASKVLSDNFTNIIFGAEDYADEYGMSITNNSYGSSMSSCELFGDYNLNSLFIDEQLRRRDTLVHVFAAGNSGNTLCPPYSKGYRTILNGWQVAKNVITVGSANHTNTISSFSSRGPVDDGRIKPEIIGHGGGNRSTRPNNNYANGSGTSYSSPGIAGILALLYEYYRAARGVNPPSHLLRAALFCTAEDLGRSGPDYIYGYGRVRAHAAQKVLEDSTYFTGAIEQGDSTVFTIDIPENAAEVRFMLAWIDPEAPAFASPALVNDLELRVIDPSSSEFEPWILNPSASGVTMAAYRGPDSINNQELVTIEFPEAGQYSVVVKGLSVPLGPQNFTLAFEIRENAINLTYPVGNEVFNPGETEYLRWEKYGLADGRTTVEVSTDGGASWEFIAQSLSPGRIWESWVVPAEPTDSGLIRISSQGYADTLKIPFSILGVSPTLVATSPCNRYAQLSWDSIPEADHYQVFQLQAGKAVFLDTAQTTQKLIGGLSSNDLTWFAVSAVSANGIAARRNRGISILADGGNQCPWPIDLAVTDITSPLSGRSNTSTGPGASESITIEIVNLGTDTVTGFNCGFSVNTGSPVIEPVEDTIAPGETTYHTFDTVVDLSSVGSYSIRSWINLSGDDKQSNDSVLSIVRHIENNPVSLPWTEDFESLDKISITSDSIGISGLETFDFDPNSSSGRLRSFVGFDMIPEGQRALTLDGNLYGTPTDNSLIASLNLSAYDNSTDDIRLVFSLMHHTTSMPDPDTIGALWIRGSDTDNWIFMADLITDDFVAGTSKTFSGTFQLSDSLLAHMQDYSSSTQIKFTQTDDASADAANRQAGYTLDNIQLFIASDDIRLLAIESPAASNAILGEDSITISIENTSGGSLNAMAYYSINSIDTISAPLIIPADTTVTFTFDQTHDFDTIGTYLLSTWISTPGDSYRDNDSIINAPIVKLPVINEYPYLENFEIDHGGWTKKGINTTLELGEPAGTIIGSAAGGIRAWATNLNGDHNNNERSYLVSPCFDLTSLVEPVLSFALIYEIEANYDYLWLEYSIGGSDWIKLDSTGTSTNWYNNTSENAWDGDRPNWRVASISLPMGECVQVRFVFESDQGLTLEGFAVDLISIHDRAAIATGFASTELNTNVSGNSWVDFMSTDSIYLSINGNGQDLGTVNATIYTFDSSTVRSFNDLYLLDRNFVINSNTSPESPLSIRFYFSDTEAQKMVEASGCDECRSIKDPFHLNLLQYSGPDQDDNINNNSPGFSSFYQNEQLNIVPYDNGYYAEVEVDSLSEFWLTSARVARKDSVVIDVTSTSDDAIEFLLSGGVNPLSNELELNPRYLVGIRFQDVYVPEGSFITDARLKLTSNNNYSDSSIVHVTGLSAYPATAFTTNMGNISGRSKGERYTRWPLSEWFTDSAYLSPSIRGIIQEVVDNPTWNAGDALALTLKGSGDQSAYSIDGSPTQAAQLIIEFDTICNRSGVLFVDEHALGSNTGLDWDNALSDLQDALELARRCNDITEIWVSSGTYYVSRGDRSISFALPPGITVYGGFSGEEVSPQERNIAENPTFLSGELLEACSSCDPAYHVVSVADYSDTIALDGVIITTANANGFAEDQSVGAGIYSLGHLLLSNSVIENANSTNPGSAIYIEGENSILELRNTTIRKSAAPAVKSTDGAELRILEQNELKQND